MALVICDLDSTLFDIDHRLPLLEFKQWDAFWAAIKDDTPNQWCVELLKGVQARGHQIAFVSGRNEVARAETLRQLESLGFGGYPVYMRPEASREADYRLKSKLFDNNHELYEADILFVIEDRQQVVDMWRSKGLTVLQCADGSY